MMGEATYVVRLTPDAEPVRFPAVSQEDMSIEEISELEVLLGVPWDRWAYFHTMRAQLWQSARMAGALEQLLSDDARREVVDVPGMLEGASWAVVGRLTSRQVVVDVPAGADSVGDDVPPAAARE